MDFGEILSKAWKIIWKHKVLWIFGLLASCGAQSWGGGGGGSSSINTMPQNGSGIPMRNLPPWMRDFFFQMQRGFEDGTIWIYIVLIVLALILLSFVLSVVFLLLRTVGKIGLVRGAWKADEGQETLTFPELLGEVQHYFWRVLLFSIVLAVLGFVVGLILFLPVILMILFTLGCGLLCLIPLSIAVSWFISVLVELTIVAILGEDLDVIKAVERAWALLTGNLAPVALMTLILFLGRMIIGIFTALPILLVIAPAVIGIIAEARAATVIGLLISGVGLMIYIVLAIFVNSVVESYFSTAWTLVFRRLTGRGADETPAPAGEAPEEPTLPEAEAAA